MTDLISAKTRQVFREHLVGWTLREISDEFDAAHIDCDQGFTPDLTGERRSLVEQYYHTINWSEPAHVKKVLQVFENVLHLAEQRSKPTDLLSETVSAEARTQVEKLSHFLKKDGYSWDGEHITAGAGLPSLNDVKHAASLLDAAELKNQIRRLEASIDADPGLAIGTAKELLETCCKTILRERGESIAGMPDLPELTKKVMRLLKLVPEGVPQAAKGSETIKRLLSNLATVCQGIAELRGLYGTGHGRDGKTVAISARHAKLAVGAATTLAVFLLETHKARAASGRSSMGVPS